MRALFVTPLIHAPILFAQHSTATSIGVAMSSAAGGATELLSCAAACSTPP